jgi:hypothetical protein
MDFLKLCLEKKESKRKSAGELLMHPWILSNLTKYNKTKNMHDKEDKEIALNNVK